MVLTAGAERAQTRPTPQIGAQQECQAKECEQLRRLIDQRTSGRIHGLDVSVDPDSGLYTVRGTAGSHHVRQLALAAVIESLGEEGVRAVRLDIAVKKPTPRR